MPDTITYKYPGIEKCPDTDEYCLCQTCPCYSINHKLLPTACVEKTCNEVFGVGGENICKTLVRECKLRDEINKIRLVEMMRRMGNPNANSENN